MQNATKGNTKDRNFLECSNYICKWLSNTTKTERTSKTKTITQFWRYPRVSTTKVMTRKLQPVYMVKQDSKSTRTMKHEHTSSHEHQQQEQWWRTNTICTESRSNKIFAVSDFILKLVPSKFHFKTRALEISFKNRGLSHPGGWASQGFWYMS